WRWRRASRGLPCGTRLLLGCLRDPLSYLLRAALGVAVFEFGDELVLPGALGAEDEAGLLGALVIEVTIHLPGEANAAMRLDVLLGRIVEGLRGGHARGSCGERQFMRAGVQRPCAVI